MTSHFNLVQTTKLDDARETIPRRGGRKKASEQKSASKSEPFQSPTRAVGGWGGEKWWRIAATVFLSVAGMWAYWPALAELVGIWASVPDYSHGFLVVPVSLCFLWARRSQFPTSSPNGFVLGCSLLIISVALRYLGACFFMSFLDAWSILLWIAATVAVLGGRPFLVWCLPSIGFLWFMVPLPFSLETALSQPLQRVATKISCWTLQLLGEPAFSEGNVIVIDEHQLEVAQACSGLRLFMGVSAVAYVYFVILHRSWWERLSVVVAVIPIAIVSNAARIVLTGVLIQLWHWNGSQQAAHDVSGWAMILFAAFLFWLLLWYLEKLFPHQEAVDMAKLVAQAAHRSER